MSAAGTLARERIKGYAADEIIGEHFSRFYTDEDRSSGLPCAARWKPPSARGASSRRLAGAQGRRRFWASVVIDPIRNDDGELIGFAKVTRDLTERREAQIDWSAQASVARRRRWRRWASSPAASRTISTIS